MLIIQLIGKINEWMNVNKTRIHRTLMWLQAEGETQTRSGGRLEGITRLLPTQEP
jgi:hypothetical protein